MCLPEQKKKVIRQQVLQLRRGLTAAERALASSQITARLLEDELYRQADCIFAYVSLQDEVQTMDLLQRMLAAGKEVYIPLVTGNHEMLPVRVHSLEDLTEGKFGILTVKNDCQEFTEAEKLDCVLVPGVAFDKQGRRLGMGGGFYDTLLPQAAKAVRIALAYQVQLVEEVPVEEHDCRVERIITENETIYCHDGKI